MSQPKIPKTTTSDFPLNSSPTSLIPFHSHHQVPLEHMVQGYKDIWRNYFQFSGNCMKRRGTNFMLDPEEIERRDEYRGYGVDFREKEIIKVFPHLNASFRIHKYSQPNFLKLYFTSMEYFADFGVKKLTQMMRKNFTKVEGLVLDLRHCRDITDRSVERICINIIRNCSHLKHLRLNFYECRNISEKAFMMLVEDISNYLPNLTHLFLNFLLCEKITDKGVEFFAHHVSRKLTKLTHLKFDFGCCKITEKGLTTLYKEFGQRLVNLKLLHVHNRGQYYLTDGLLKALEENIIKGLPGLQHLSIRIGQAYEFSGEALESLFSKIGQYLPGLISLSIQFFSCEKINDDNVRTLLTKLHENCKNLTDFKVHFEGAGKVKGTQEFPDKQTIVDYLQSEFKPRETSSKSVQRQIGSLFKK